MNEYYPQQGLMWIRLNPGERPIWIGGDYHVAPDPSIAHLFANIQPQRRDRVDQKEIEGVLFEELDFVPQLPVIFRRNHELFPQTWESVSQFKWT